MAEQFERETRYAVFKNTDLKYLSDDELMFLNIIANHIHDGRLEDKKEPLQCAVIESDWSVHDEAWALIEKEFNNDKKPPAINGRRFMPSENLNNITSDMKAQCIGEFSMELKHTCTACFYNEPDENCEVCAGEITYYQNHAIDWTTTKDIYQKMLAAKLNELKGDA